MKSNVTPATAAGSAIIPGGTSPGASPQTALGKTEIDDSVVAKVAGIAAREVAGVYTLGGGTARALGAIRGAMNTSDPAQGISVEVDGERVSIDVVIVAQYPAPLQRVTDDVRSAIVTAVEDLVGLDVTAVDITVIDVHIAADEAVAVAVVA